MSAHATLHHHTTAELTAMKNEIENIKTHFATRADMIKWTVGVGVATVLSIIGVVSGLLLSMDARMTHTESRMEARMIQMDTRLTNTLDTLSKKIDVLVLDKNRR